MISRLSCLGPIGIGTLSRIKPWILYKYVKVIAIWISIYVHRKESPTPNNSHVLRREGERRPRPCTLVDGLILTSFNVCTRRCDLGRFFLTQPGPWGSCCDLSWFSSLPSGECEFDCEAGEDCVKSTTSDVCEAGGCVDSLSLVSCHCDSGTELINDASCGTTAGFLVCLFLRDLRGVGDEENPVNDDGSAFIVSSSSP